VVELRGFEPLASCMPCSFGLLQHARSEADAPRYRACRGDRGCPLDTVRARCLWHVGGTAGENDDARTWRQRCQLDQWMRPVSGDYRLVGKGHRPAAGVGWES
jgi:hypothetical protein